MAAAAELLRRRESRKSLRRFCCECGHLPAAHHDLLIEKLEAVSRGEIPRLMVFMPPGSAKSTYASVDFPAWWLNLGPERCVITASHTAELAHTFGRRVRNLVEDKAALLGYALAEDSQAAGRWSTDKGGEFYGAGVGGNITGRRADLAIIDDPVKSREAADSEITRQRQYEWYRFDLETRLKPGAAVILIMTRWHEDDLAGRLLREEPERWTVLRLPMEAEDDDPLGRAAGERLWAGWFTADMVADAKRDPRVWSALYQQSPTAEGGNFFKSEWLLPYRPGDLPVNLHVYMASDHAVSEAESADYTVAGCAGVDENGVIWILPDIVWEKADSSTVTDKLIDLLERRKPFVWWAEKGHISKAIGPFLRERMMKRKVYCTIEEVTPTNDKKSRATSIKHRMAMGLVRFPVFAPWWAKAHAEMMSFPAGTHDDFVDMLAHLGGALDKLVPPMAKRGPSLSEAMAEQAGGSNADQQENLGIWAG